MIVPVVIVAGVLAFQAADRSSAQVGRLFDSLSSSTLSAAAETIAGRASVIDADTIEIAGQRIRFNGVDAPESSQYCEDAKGFEYACGRAAAEALDEFLAASRPAKCSFVEWDQYGRFVGNCLRADGRSVAGWLVESGHALDWPRYSLTSASRKTATFAGSRPEAPNAGPCSRPTWFR